VKRAKEVLIKLMQRPLQLSSYSWWSTSNLTGI